MADIGEENMRVFLRSRPGVNNPPSEENFDYEKIATKECGEDEILVKTLYLSVDPFLRCRLNEDSGVDYVKAWEIGETLNGMGVGVVLQSKNKHFQPKDIVQSSSWPFQKTANLNPLTMANNPLTSLEKVESELVKEHPSLSLGIVGMTGLTAIIGIQEMAHIMPGRNMTVVVSGAAGACGSAAGQIAKLEGCGKVVGICGTDEKCKYLTEELCFDAAINYKTTDNILEKKISEICPAGVDVYFDNVGGGISNQVIRCMNKDTHIVLCGQISQYNRDVPYPPPLPQDTQDILHNRSITRKRFLVLQYQHKFPEALKQLEDWVSQGKLKYRETVEVGLENAGKAFVSMMSGGNIGKQLVHVANM